MKKICWLDINSSYSHSSWALPLIEAQSVRYETKYEWVVAKGTIKSNISEIVNNIVQQNPDYVVYTSWLFTCEYLDKVLSRAKAILPNLIVIGGGPEYLGENENFLRSHDYIDYVVRGEGEHSFFMTLEFAQNPAPQSSIEGLCYINYKGEYIDNGRAKVMDFVDLELPEKSKFFDWSKPFVQLETTRGCFNNCAFCVSGGDRPLRNQSIELVAKRISEIHQKGIKDVRMLDRTFNASVPRALAMLDIFASYPDMNFHLELHPALLTAEVKQKIASLPKGVLHTEAGIQSLDDKVLRACGRAGEKEKALEGLKMLCGLDNLETHADLIAGLPYYTLKQIYKDVHTLAEIGVAEIQLELLKLLAGTKMRMNAKQLGIVFSPISPYEVLKTDEMSPQDLAESMVLSKILDWYYNNSAWQNVFRKIILNKGNFLKNFVDYITELECYASPLSQERQGMLFYEFLEQHYPQFTDDLRIEWIKNGLSLRKKPTTNVVSYTHVIDGNESIIEGEYNPDMRLYSFDTNLGTYIFGFDRSKEHSKPLYIALKQKNY